MLKKIIYFAIINACLAFNPAVASLLGVDVNVRNTIQAPFTSGAEVEVGVAGPATVSATSTEFPSFVDLYDIDISDNSISFTWVDTPFSQSISGSVGSSVFDRNYFEFAFPTNMVITDISFDASASGLLTGSTLPTAQLISSNQVLTVFGEGVIRDLGFNPSFTVTTTVVPLPMSLHFMIMGLATIGATRFRKGLFLKNQPA